jgi:ATP synthase F0 subunit b
MSGAKIIGSEIFAFLVILYILWRYVMPRLNKALTARQEAIRAQIEGSREAREHMEQAEAQFQRAHEDSAAEAAQMRDHARAQSAHIVDELRDRARTESERIRQRGQEQLAAERDTLVREIRGDVGRLAVDLAERIVTEAMRDDSLRRASVARAIGQIRPGARLGRPEDAERTPVTTAEERS